MKAHASIECPARTRRALLGALVAIPLVGCTTVTVKSDPSSPPSGLAIDLGDLVLVSGAWNSAHFAGGSTLYTAIERVHNLAYRLRTSAGTLCGGTLAPQWGLVALNLSVLQTLGLQASAPALGVDERLTAFHVVEGSPAAAAGLGRGDRIVHVDGDPVPSGAAAVETIGRRLARGERALVLGILREGVHRTLSLQPAFACGIRPVLESNREFFWDEQSLPIASVGDPLLAFAIAHRGALGLQLTATSVTTVSPAVAEAANFSLSLLSLTLGIATLGGWSAKPINVFDERDTARVRAVALHELRQAASQAADKMALRLLQQAGFNLDDLIAEWRVHAQPVTAGDDPPRLRALNEEIGLLPGRAR